MTQARRISLQTMLFLPTLIVAKLVYAFESVMMYSALPRRKPAAIVIKALAGNA